MYSKIDIIIITFFFFNKERVEPLAIPTLYSLLNFVSRSILIFSRHAEDTPDNTKCRLR